MSDTWWSWGLVQSDGSVLLDGTTVPVLVGSSLIGALIPGERVWSQMVGRAVIVHGRSNGGRGWSYTGLPAAGWVSLARFPGSGRAEATFSLNAEDSGDHDQLRVLVQVAYSWAAVNVLGYNTFGRLSSPIITGIRYLNDSADATYGPGILQVYLSETPTGTWSVRCEQEPDPVLRAWEPLTFSTSVSGYNTTTPAHRSGVYVTDAVDLPLSNGWAHYGSPWARPRIQMLPGGLISLSGFLTGSARTSLTIANLPEGTRPQGTMVFSTLGYNGAYVAGRTDVRSDGLVVLQNPTNPVWASLDGIVYPAYQ